MLLKPLNRQSIETFTCMAGAVFRLDGATVGTYGEAGFAVEVFEEDFAAFYAPDA
jgi:hypothetical protein